MRIVVVAAAGDDDDDVDCADQREQELQLYDLVARRNSNDDAAHSQSLSRRVGESGADDGDDRPSPQNPNGAQSRALALPIHSQHLTGAGGDPISRSTLQGCDAQ